MRAADDLLVAGVAADGRAAYDAIVRTDAHVALLDVRMPQWDGFAVARRVRGERRRTRILFVSAYRTDDLAAEALRAGAIGMLGKGATADQIRDAIRIAHAGEETAIGPRSARFRSEARDDAGRPLTARELEILQWIATGMTAPEIALRLRIALPTVKSHLQKLYGKLGVNGKGAAVAEGMRRGLVE